MKRRMRNRTYGVVRGGQGQPNRLLDAISKLFLRPFNVFCGNSIKAILKVVKVFSFIDN